MIKAYTGQLGTGKTLGMVADAVEEVRKRRVTVYSNMVGLKFPEAIYLRDLTALAHIENGLVLLDEASVCMASRYWQQVPREVLAAFAQARKAGLDMWYTAQHLNRVDTVVREITNYEVKCRKMGRWFWQQMVDPTAKVAIARRFRRYRREVYALYDTLERINIDGGGGAQVEMFGYPPPAYSTPERERGGITGRIFEVRVLHWIGVHAVMSREARRAYAWMDERGYLFPAGRQRDGWMHLLASEVARRRWLAVFGLSAQDVYPWTRYEHPWMENWSPEEVKVREEEREKEAALELAAAKTRFNKK